VTDDNRTSAVEGGFWEQLDHWHAEQPATAPLMPVPPYDGSRLSSAQERLWLLERVHSGARSHITYIVVRLTGPVDLANLQTAIDTVVERHEMLRTSLHWESGSLRQRVDHHVPVKLRVEDREESGEHGRPVIGRWVDDTLAIPFDLSVSPIFRAGLLRLGAQKHVLLLASHRSVADSRSLEIVFGDVAAGYGAFANDTEPRPADVSARMTHPAALERANLAREGYEDDLTYWMAHLRGANYNVLPPADRSLLDRSSERRSAPLDRDLVSRLEASLGRRVPVYAILLTAYAQLLARFTGEDRLTVAVPDSLRHADELRSVVGPFDNTLVLNLDLSGDPTFRELAGRVAALLTESVNRRRMPVETLLRALWPETYPEHGPLARAAFDVGDRYPPDVEIAGLRMSVLDHSRRCEEYPLMLRITQVEGDFVAHVHHQGREMSAELIDAFLAAYRVLLERIAEDPGRRIHDTRLVGADARAWALPQKVREYPLITELVARARAQAPDSPMLVRGDRSWSYGELDVQASELADVLRSVGHSAGETVVVCPANRCFELYAGLLGAWQAGGVVALLDPSRPHAEREAMMARARGRTLLLIGDRAPEWWPTTGMKNVVLSSPGKGVSILRHEPGRTNPPFDESAAYIFFTSGTTGTPKALLGRHTSLSHFVLWQKQEFGYSADDRCAQLTSLFTDGVLRDIFTPLISGSPLYLPADPTMRPSDPGVLGWLSEAGITRAHTMPSISTRWLGDAQTSRPLDALRYLFFSGEPLTGGLVDRWQRKAPSAQLVNLYGASECTMVQAFHRVRRRPGERTHPAGRGMPDAQLLALTPSGAPCGIGEVGQVHIRTPYASAGYLDLVNSAFITNFFRDKDDPGDEIFRTGDHGRVRSDGTLEILGRSSETSRIRGMTVHAERVNAVLAGSAGVRASAVVQIDRAGQEPCLAAFVAFDGSDAAGMWSIRRALRERFSSWEVPDYIVPIAELPVTTVGKLDRRELREIFQRHQASSHAGPAQSPLAATVASVWTTVLDGTPIEADAHFFGLGAGPREAIKATALLQAELGTAIDVDAIFTVPVFSEFVNAVRDLSAGHDDR
jgi:amino acid adenylation domain-containing protein